MLIPRPRALLLDAGNTIVFLDHDALADAIRAPGRDVSGATLRAAEAEAKKAYQEQLSAGLSHEAGWYLYMQVLFETAGIRREEARAAAREARHAHDAFNLWRKVPDDLDDALARAKAGGLRLGVVSNAEGTIAELLDELGLGHWFEVIVDSALEGVRKPDPEIFRRALQRLAIAPGEALYAGDIPEVDVAGAQAAGMQAALIDPYGYFRDHRASPRFGSVNELVTALGL